MADDLNNNWDWLFDLIRRIERLESGAILENSSITEGRMRFIGGLLLIDTGGTLQVIGTVNGEGDFTWTGPWTLTGLGEVTGDVAWSGDLNLTGNITVLPGGKIQIGGMTIDPFTGGGRIDFGGGRTIDASSGYMAIRDGDRFVVFNSSGVSINGGAGSPTITIGPGGVTMSGLPTKEAWAANGAVEGTIWQDAAGKVYRVIP